MNHDSDAAERRRRATNAVAEPLAVVRGEAGQRPRIALVEKTLRAVPHDDSDCASADFFLPRVTLL